MEYAVFESGGKQYKVSVGDLVEVDSLNSSQGVKVTFKNVFLIVSDGLVLVGTPTVLNAKIIASVIDERKGKKIRVLRYKSKVRYRRAMGFRARRTYIKIEKIEKSSKTSSK